MGFRLYFKIHIYFYLLGLFILGCVYFLKYFLIYQIPSSTVWDFREDFIIGKYISAISFEDGKYAWLF